ncbi:MAG: hypothetical protein H0X27_13975, partial [Caulobacteraceae bacterium]|nr:hypothetical protein [Caulobacteraceae bacterium]
MPRALFAGLSAALLLAACASDKVIGRYQSAICSPDPSTSSPCHDIVPTASAFAMSIPTPASGGAATGTSFPERALAAYVNVLGRPDLTTHQKSLALRNRDVIRGIRFDWAEDFGWAGLKRWRRRSRPT